MSELTILGILVVVSVGLIIYALLPAKDDKDSHLRRRMAGKRSDQPENPFAPKRDSSTAKEVMEKVAPLAMKPVMPGSEEEMTALRDKLSQAGFRRETAVRYFLASKTIVAIILAVAALVICMANAMPFKQLVGIAAFADLPPMFLDLRFEIGIIGGQQPPDLIQVQGILGNLFLSDRRQQLRTPCFALRQQIDRARLEFRLKQPVLFQ